jgi:serine/threonine protein kinase
VIGQLIRHYRIEEVVGRGGMGVVYRALDVNLERTVAVKILSALFRDDPEFVERFRQEARIQAGLNHPNIATLFDFFVWNDMPVAVMEFIKGETLRSMVDRTGPIPAHIALPIFIQALRGVAAGHKRRIIHRDLKPHNLMITDEGIVKVTDFGIAKVRGATGLTQDSTRVGSASYMAPEQILGRPVDVQTDIYVMGGTLYELLSGRPPFQGISQFEIDTAHVRDLPKAPTAYCPNIPPAAVDAVMRALAKEPSARFANAEEFIRALPDLHGVPYIATNAVQSISAGTATDDETRQQQGAPKIAPVQHAGTSTDDETRQQQSAPKIAPVQHAGTSTDDETRQQQNAPNVLPMQRVVTAAPGATSPQQSAPKVARTWRVSRGATFAVAGLFVVLLTTGIVLYSARQSGVGPDHGPGSQTAQTKQPAPTQETQPQTQLATPPAALPVTPPNTAVSAPPTMDRKPAESVMPASSPTPKSSRDLTGTWTGTYLDRSGRPQLQLLNLQIQQVPDGAITGRFTYKAANSAGEDCTLDKSSYSMQSKRLRLIVHCRNPNHPKYLNVPLEFTDVDPGASSIEGGRLAFHLADDIVVTLERAKGI